MLKDIQRCHASVENVDGVPYLSFDDADHKWQSIPITRHLAHDIVDVLSNAMVEEST